MNRLIAACLLPAVLSGCAISLGACGFQGAIGPVLSGLGGLGIGSTAPPTGSSAVAVILQEAQDVHNVSMGIAAINQGPVTMMLPTPVTITPTAPPATPPVIVRPVPPPVATEPPSSPPVVSPGGGPIVTPSARLRRPHAYLKPAEHPADMQALFGPDGHLKAGVTIRDLATRNDIASELNSAQLEGR